MAAQVKNSSEISKKINQFLDYLAVEKGSSPLTLRNYRHYLRRFVLWLKREKIVPKLRNINQETVAKFRLYLAGLPANKKETLSRKTQGYHIIALRSFLKWLIKTDHQVLSPDKLDLPKTADREIRFLNGQEIDRLLNAPSLSTIIGKRDKAILEVLFSTGVRVSELVSLDKENIDLDRKEFGILGKGGRARLVFLSGRAASWLEKYLKARNDHYKPLFIRHKGKLGPAVSDEKMRLTARSVQRMVKKYARKIKLSVEVTPHIIRHSYATDLLMAGADLRSVQEMLGHKNVSTTQIYTHVTNKQLREVHSAFHGKGGA
jgi:site-specific recombinase XerD